MNKRVGTGLLPITAVQRRIYEAWAADTSKPRAQLAAELGVSRERVRQALTVVRTKMAHQGTTA